MIDIQAGDVVVCVDAGPDYPENAGCYLPIKVRNLYRVRRLWVATNTRRKGPVVELVGIPCGTVSGGYGTWRFRKVRKATDAFTTQIKAIRPIREDA